MAADPPRRHVLSIDDGPFEKFKDREVLAVGVITAGRDLVEGILTTRLNVDGEAATERLARWITESRFRPVLRVLLLNGISIAGLSIVDLPELNRRTGLPVIAVNRKLPQNREITEALQAAGFPHRIPLLDRAGPPHAFGSIYFSCSGIEPEEAREILQGEEGRSYLPEGLRLAHIIAQGVILGESRGRP